MRADDDDDDDDDGMDTGSGGAASSQPRLRKPTSSSKYLAGFKLFVSTTLLPNKGDVEHPTLTENNHD